MLSGAARHRLYDEVDKISRKSDNPSITRDDGEGVQQALLKIMEGTVASVPRRAGANIRRNFAGRYDQHPSSARRVRGPEKIISAHPRHLDGSGAVVLRRMNVGQARCCAKLSRRISSNSAHPGPSADSVIATWAI
jgi:hypothetical protein